MKLATLLLGLGAAACASADVSERGVLIVEIPAELSAEELATVDTHLQRRFEAAGFDVRGSALDLERRRIAFTFSARVSTREADVRELAERMGAMRLVPIVDPDASMPGAEDEREGMLQWRGVYPEGDPQRYHDTPASEGGPADLIRWYEDGSPRLPWVGCQVRDARLDPTLAFTERDLATVVLRDDGRLELRWKRERAESLRAYATRLANVTFALVDDERIVVARVPTAELASDVLVVDWKCDRSALEAVRAAWSIAASSGRLVARPRVVDLR